PWPPGTLRDRSCCPPRFARSIAARDALGHDLLRGKTVEVVRDQTLAGLPMALARKQSACQVSPEFAGRHGLGEEEALDDVEAHVAHAAEVLPHLDAFGNRACADRIRELQNAAANAALQAIVGTAGNEIPIDLYFHEREMADIRQQRRPFGAQVVDRDPD